MTWQARTVSLLSGRQDDAVPYDCSLMLRTRRLLDLPHHEGLSSLIWSWDGRAPRILRSEKLKIRSRDAQNAVQNAVSGASVEFQSCGAADKVQQLRKLGEATVLKMERNNESSWGTHGRL